MITINDTTVVVFNTDDIRDAVSSDNGIAYIYFGDNITLAYGISIYPDKPSLIFDGTYENVTHTFTDMDNSDLSNTIGVRSASSITITFKNINLIGRNFFGIPYVPNSPTYSGVSTIYQNVSYSGTQLSHNPYGFASYTDCNITVNNNEVAEINRLEIGGVTTIEKSNRENATFWFYGSDTRRPYLKILSGAEVTITTEHYFMFESSPPDYIIEPDASLTLNTNSGISYDAGHTINSFLVDENASFSFTQKANRGFATLYLSGALTVGEGAKFYMQANFSNNYPLIHFSGSAPALYLNKPRSFALYNKGGTAATAFFFAAQISFVFAGNQVNLWEVPAEFPAAGTFDDIPSYKWNRASYSLFRIEGRANNSQTIIDSHDLTAEDLKQMSSLDDFELHKAVVFSAGNLPLSVNRIVIGKKPISGKTEKKAKVRVFYMGVGPYPDYNADDRGIFSAEQTTPTVFAETFSVTANTPFLLTTLMVEAQEEGGLSIIEAPEAIAFSLHPMEDFSDIILPRKVTDDRVLVLDERSEKTQWVIWAKISGPLQTEENDVLDNAVVFADEEGELITLKTEYEAIHTDGPYIDVDDVEIRWTANRGLLARVTVPIRSGRKYTAQLDWVVCPIGVPPEGGD